MSESPTIPALRDIQPEPHQGDVEQQREHPADVTQASDVGTWTLFLTTCVGAGIVVGLLYVIAGVTDRFDKMLGVGSPVVEAVSTVVATAFAIQLYRLSKRTQAENVASAKSHATELAATRTVMAAQQLAMEELAEAMRASAEVAKRALVASHPPTIAVKAVKWKRDENGQPVIEFCIQNVGHSAATIQYVVSASGLHSGRFTLGRTRKAPHIAQHISLRDNVVKRGRPVAGEHRCENINPDELPDDPPNPTGLFGAIPVSSLANMRPAASTLMTFWVLVGIEDETGGLDSMMSHFQCEPPAHNFESVEAAADHQR